MCGTFGKKHADVKFTAAVMAALVSGLTTIHLKGHTA
jgi:hypothetical protein